MQPKIFLSVLAVLLIFGSLVKATDITDCANLTTPGTYYLTADILNSNGLYYKPASIYPSCITIFANNTTLDCQGHTIQGNASLVGGSAILFDCVSAPCNITNVTIENCHTENWDNGIATANGVGGNVTVSYVNISNVVVNNASSDGIMGPNTYFVKLDNISVDEEGNAEGIYFYGDNFNFTDILVNNSAGDGIIFDRTSTNITFNNVEVVNGQWYGIELQDVSHSLFTNVISSNNDEYGIMLYQSTTNADYNTFTNITLFNNTNGGCSSFFPCIGIYLSGTNNNIFSSMDVAGNVVANSYGIQFDSASNNSLHNNLFNNTINAYFTSSVYPNNWNNTFGGNYWTNSSGTGYSDNCTDANHDGICDQAYDVLNNVGCTPGVNCSNNTDYMPLTAQNTGPLIYNCSEGSPDSLTFATYDEDTNASIIGNQTMAFNVYESANDSFVGGYSFQYLNVYNATLCFSLNGEYFNSIEEYYSEPNYPMRTYYMNHAVVNNTNGQIVPLYLSQLAKLTFIHLEDGYGNAAPNDYIFANRYFVANNSYLTTDIVLTDAFGNATTYLIPNTVFYQFVVVGSNGQLLNAFSRQTIQCDASAPSCSVILKLPLIPQQEYWSYWGRVAYHCDVNESNKPASVLIDCTTTDTSGLLHRVVLNTWLVNLFSNTLECNSSSFAPSSQLFCTIYNVSGNVYTYQLKGTFNDTVVFVQDTLDYRIRQLFGIYGLLPGLLLILALTLLGAAISPVATVAGGALGVGVSSVIGLIDLPISSIVALIAVSLILIYKMR